MAEGVDGKAQIKIGGRAMLRMPILPLETPVRVQLQTGGANCWEAIHASTRFNTEERFDAKAD